MKTVKIGRSLVLAVLLTLAECGADDSTNPKETPGELGPWQSLGPEGGSVSKLIPSPDGLLYAVMDGKNLFRLDEAAEAWRPVGNPSQIQGDDCQIYDLTMDPRTPKTLYLAANCSEANVPPIYRSLDGGQNWQALGSGFSTEDASSGFSLAVHPRTPSILYAAGGRDTLYRSDDAGEHWRLLAPTGITQEFVALDPRDTNVVYSGGGQNYCGDFQDCGLVRSTDGGLHWSPIPTIYRPQFLIQHPSAPDRLFSGDFEAAYESSDGGRSWRNLHLDLVRTMAFTATEPDTYYAVAGYYAEILYKSTDAGKSWEKLNLGRPAEIQCLAVDALHPQNLYLGMPWGALRSKDGGHSWSVLSAGLSSLKIGDLAVTPQKSSKLWAATGDDLFSSEDGGEHWRGTNHRADSVELDPADSDTLYSIRHYGGVSKSVNGGAQWTDINKGLEIDGLAVAAGVLLQNPRKPGILYLGTEGSGAFRTTNGGASWVPINSGLEFVLYPFVQAMAMRPGSENVVYSVFETAYVELFPAGSRLFRSVSDGNLWEPLPGALDGIHVRALAIAPSAPDSMFAATERGLFGSRDAGVSWSRLALPSEAGEDVLSVAVDAKNAALLVAGTAGRGTYSSKDGGQSWKALDPGPLARRVSVLLAHPGQPGLVYAGTLNNGVLRTRLSSAGN